MYVLLLELLEAPWPSQCHICSVYLFMLHVSRTKWGRKSTVGNRNVCKPRSLCRISEINKVPENICN